MDLLAPTAGETIATLPAAPADGPALRYRVWEEPERPPRATLALLSGVMSNTAWFRPLADVWRGMGYRVVGLERRGSGLNHASSSSEAGERPDTGCEDTPSAEALIDDACRQLEAGRAPGRPLVLVGWCWGAILAVHVALRLQGLEGHGQPADGQLAGLALLTPGIHPSAVLAERMRGLAEAAKGLPREIPALASPITDEMFTAGPALDGFIRRDRARWQRFSPRFLDVSTRLTLAARMRLRRLSLPVLVVLAQDDVTTDNAAIQAELARLPADRVCTTTLPGAHGLQFEAPRALGERLDAWAHDALGV
jgi:pimeloyl-ACP methyl ester carboxylesterase